MYLVHAKTRGADGSVYNLQFLCEEHDRVFSVIRHSLEMEEASEQELEMLTMIRVERVE